MGIADPVISDWVSTQAPALTVAMPVLGAVFVLLESRFVEQTAESGLLCRLQAEGLAAFALGLFVGRARTLWLLRLWFLRFPVSLDLALCHIVLPLPRRAAP